MLIPNHPDDERLTALAWREPDATADEGLTSHVTGCPRCTATVDDLGGLRAALADLPDVAPQRPLRLLPPVEANGSPATDRLGGWARRFFAPVMASGAALALVGAIGTVGPQAQMGSAPAEGDQVTTFEGAGGADAGAEAEEDGAAQGGEAPAAAASEPGGDAVVEGFAPYQGDSAERDSATDELTSAAPPDAFAAERSPWPMVLFVGVALMVAAALLRWILVPRAG